MRIVTLIAFLVLLLAALAALIIAGFYAEDGPSGDYTWAWWILGAFVLGGGATALANVRGLLWYLAVWGAIAVLVGVVQGITGLVALAEDHPWGFGIGALVFSALALIGAIPLRHTGHPWLELIAVGAAACVAGFAALTILADFDNALTDRGNTAVAAVGTLVAGVGGVALLVQGPLNADGRIGSAAGIVLLGLAAVTAAAMVVITYRSERT